MLNPGRELDVLIAEKVFGAKVSFLNQQDGWRIDYQADKNECNYPIETDWGIDGWRLKRYSTNIAAAWELVEKLTHESDRGAKRSFELHRVMSLPKEYNQKQHYIAYFSRSVSMTADTAPLAICLAALSAVE